MSASLVLVIVMAVMFASGIFLMLERSLTRVLLGFLLVGNATNLLILIMGGSSGVAPILNDSTTAEQISDPLVQAFSLTAIVITFGVSAFLLALIYRSWRLSKVDEVVDDAEDIAIRQRDAELDVERDDPHDVEVDHLDELSAAHDLAETGDDAS